MDVGDFVNGTVGDGDSADVEEVVDLRRRALGLIARFEVPDGPS